MPEEKKNAELIRREDVFEIIRKEIQEKPSFIEHNAQLDILEKVEELPTVLDEEKVNEKIAELKDVIVSLKCKLLEKSIPQGHCPYAYCDTSKHKKEDFDCNSLDWDCDECQRRFFQDKKEDIRREIEEY